MNYSAVTHSHNITLHIYSYLKRNICWWTAPWPTLHCNCYSMQLLSITQSLVLIIYAKCWRIKKPWSSSGRLPEALNSAHDLCINTGWQKEDMSLPEYLRVSLELSSICLKWLHETPADVSTAGCGCPCFNKLERGSRLGEGNWRRTTLWFDIMVKDVRMQLL